MAFALLDRDTEKPKMTVDEAIEELKSRKEHYELGWCCEELIEALDLGIKALENQKSIIEELEKIKSEIQGLIDFEESCCGNTTLGYQCLGVIEDRIAEMKGEQE